MVERYKMDAQQRYVFCQNAQEYVEKVAAHLAINIGEAPAILRVFNHLGLVLESMLESSPPQDIAWSLIPKPHNVPMPGT